MSQNPRHIKTDRSLNRPTEQRAEKATASRPVQPAQPDFFAEEGPAEPLRRAGAGGGAKPPRAPSPAGRSEPPRRRKKKKKTPLWLPLVVTLAVLAVISGVVVYAASMVNRVEENIRPEEDAPSIIEEIQTLEEYKGDVVNILVCGIDYEEGRNYSNDPTSNDGMTDMILYCQFDIKGGALRMLQIPRNSLVTAKSRKVALSNGKTYAATNYQINSVSHLSGRFVCKCYSQYIKRIHPLMIHEIGNPVCYHSCLSASCTGKYEKWSIHMLTSLLLHIIKSCHNSSCINKKRHYVYTKHMFHFICSV